MPIAAIRMHDPLLAIATVLMLAGCSSMGAPEQTAAIPAQPIVAAPGGTAPAATAAAMAPDGAASGQTVAGAQGAPVATTAAQAVPVAMAPCDQLKVELAAFKAEKIPEKLAQFGQSKYAPTPDESTRFARYVAVNQASKEKCGTMAATTPMVKKKVVKAVLAEPAAVKPVVMKKAVKAAVEPPAAPAVVKKVAVQKKVAVPAATEAEAVDPLTNPTAAAPANVAPLEGIMTTGTSG